MGISPKALQFLHGMPIIANRVSLPLPWQTWHGAVGTNGNKRHPVAPQVSHGTPKSELLRSLPVPSQTLHLTRLYLSLLSSGEVSIVILTIFHHFRTCFCVLTVFNDYDSRLHFEL
jgi:hypothetical protein